jgi:tRNA pseudouridine38-40 synthase
MMANSLFPTRSRRMRFAVAYDGTPYAGWQSQKGGGAIQDVIEAAFLGVCGRPVRIVGAGRTDAGVHALGQVFHADLPPDSLAPQILRRALNARLPPSIRILRAAQTTAAFHARFSAISKVYRYTLHTGEVLPPFFHNRAWHVPTALDMTTLRAAATLFRGTRNFAAFSANRGKPMENPVRTIHMITISKKGRVIAVDIEGDGFLYKMVRMIVAAMVRHAQGRETAADIAHALEKGHPTSRFVAPAGGLTLVRVRHQRGTHAPSLSRRLPESAVSKSCEAGAAARGSKRSTPRR